MTQKLRVALWLIMIPAAACNALLSFLGCTVLSLIAGVVGAACLVGLIVSYVTGGKR